MSEEVDVRLCLACGEEEAEGDEDNCWHCDYLTKEQNKDKFIARETY